MKAAPIREKEYPKRHAAKGGAERRGGSERDKEDPGMKGGGRRRQRKGTNATGGITGASDSAISGNDRKKGRSFVRAERTAEERSAKKNEGQLAGMEGGEGE